MGKRKPSTYDKRCNFTVYLHPQIREILDVLIADHGERKAIVNGALWLFARQPLEVRVASCRAYHQCSEFGVPIETPQERAERLERDLSEMQAALAHTAQLADSPSSAGRRSKRP